MKKVFKVVDKVSSVLGWIGIAMFIIILLGLVGNVVGRLVFNKPITGLYELVQYSLVIMFFAAYPYAQTKRRHISVTMLTGKFPMKVQLVLFTINMVLAVGITACLTYGFFKQGQYVAKIGQTTGTLLIPLYPVFFFACVLTACFCIVLLMDVIRGIMAVFGDQECEDSIKAGWV